MNVVGVHDHNVGWGLRDYPQTRRRTQNDEEENDELARCLHGLTQDLVDGERVILNHSKDFLAESLGGHGPMILQSRHAVCQGKVYNSAIALAAQIRERLHTRANESSEPAGLTDE